MMDWLILTAANILKGAIVGGLSLLSWGVHAFAPCDVVRVDHPAGRAVVVLACAKTDEDIALQNAIADALAAARLAQRRAHSLRHLAVLRVGEIVPPIRVEAVYSPDLLLPPSVLLATPPLPPLPPTAAAPAPAASRAT
jgi:hypothetical protein